MSGRHLLDTNVVVALLNGEAKVTARIDALPEVFLSIVTLGELYFGAANSGRPEANAARVSDLAATCTLVVPDAETARRYGEFRVELKKRGRPIPENDLWIAAGALQHGLTLVTRDLHFDHVRDLEIAAW